MRNRYAVTDFYPVMRGHLVSHTESQRFLFRTYALAKAFYLLLRFMNLFVPPAFARHYSVWLHEIPKHSLNVSDLGLDYRDSGRWRSYSLSTSGNTLAELFENATVSETDQDGETLNSYGLDQENHASELAKEAIFDFVKKEGVR